MLICAALTFSLVELDSRFTWYWDGLARRASCGWHRQIAKSKTGDKDIQCRTGRLWASLGLQFVNVKIILYGITALSTFVHPLLASLFGLSAWSLLLAIGALGNLCWALAGHLLSACFAVRAATGTGCWQRYWSTVLCGSWWNKRRQRLEG